MLYHDDCYTKEFDATVEDVKDGRFIVLDDTAFYPSSGGQPNDTGKIIRKSDGKEFPVVYVGKFDGNVSHEVAESGLQKGDKIHGVIDWDRRYILMRMHTAAHVLSRVIHEESGANTSGNQLGVEKSRIDFTLDDFDRDAITGWIDKANDIIKKGMKVEKIFMKKEDAMKLEGFAGPSPHLMQDLDVLRVVKIGDIDSQPCGGTHLDDIKEIGEIVFVKAQNKGKSNRRIYYSLKD